MNTFFQLWVMKKFLLVLCVPQKNVDSQFCLSYTNFQFLIKMFLPKNVNFRNSNKISWFDMRSDWHFPYQPRVLICKNVIKLLQIDWTILSKVCERIFPLGFCVLFVKYVKYQKAYFLRYKIHQKHTFLDTKYTKTQRIQKNKHFPLLD